VVSRLLSREENQRKLRSLIVRMPEGGGLTPISKSFHVRDAPPPDSWTKANCVKVRGVWISKQFGPKWALAKAEEAAEITQEPSSTQISREEIERQKAALARLAADEVPF
jgi:hypothetical protein